MRILIVEDEAEHLAGHVEHLKRAGHTVDFAQAKQRALTLLNTCAYDVAVIDLILIQSTGDTVVAQAVAKGVGVIVMTAAGDERIQGLVDSLTLLGCDGPYILLRKPFSHTILDMKIQEAFQNRISPIARAIEKTEPPAT